MPYCDTVFQTVKPEQVENVLSKFAQECFVGGQAAYRLDDDSYSIDAGENDIRAIYDEPNTVIRFFAVINAMKAFTIRSFKLLPPSMALLHHSQ
jgi:pyrroline-5-carboxylate reductase